MPVHYPASRASSVSFPFGVRLLGLVTPVVLVAGTVSGCKGGSSAQASASQPRATASALPSVAASASANMGTGAAPTAVAKTDGTGTGANPPEAPTYRSDLDDPHAKDIAMRLVSSAENSTTDWRQQFSYIEDIGDGRGYTAGIIGFTTGTHDLLEVVERYTATKPDNVLAKYLPALRAVDGSDSHDGLDPGFPNDWKAAANDPAFEQAQEYERDRVYFNPAVNLAKQDGLPALGQFAYYDATVMHGVDGLYSIRARALARARTPAAGGGVTTYLNAFLDERVVEMKKEAAHSDTSRIDTEQREFLRDGNLVLKTPLTWQVYGDTFFIGG